MNAGQFRKYLIKAYEGEVRGCAYFEGLAAYFDDPRQRHLLQHLAEIESSTAAWLAPVLKRYGLEARRDATSTGPGIRPDSGPQRRWGGTQRGEAFRS